MDKKKISVKLELYGEKKDIVFTKGKYMNNGALYVGAMSWDCECRYWESWCNVTVNLPGTLDKNQAFIDHNCSPKIIDWLCEEGYAKPTGRSQHSGFVDFQLYEFTDKFLDNVYDVTDEIGKGPESDELIN